VSNSRDQRDRPLSLLALRLPPWFERRTVTNGPGDELAAGDASWHDEIVSVEAGALEVAATDGVVVRLAMGAMLFLDGMAHVTLRNPGPEPTVLAAIRRRAQ
jgi:hypothetical protein